MCIRFIRLIELARALCANRVSMLAVWHKDGVCASVQSALKPLILRLRLSQWANCTKTASRKTYTTLCCVVQYMLLYVCCIQAQNRYMCNGARSRRGRRRRCCGDAARQNYARPVASASQPKTVREVYRLSAEQSDSFTPQKCQLMSLVLVRVRCPMVDY